MEAFIHAGVENNAQIILKWIDAEVLEKSQSLDSFFEDVQGILVPYGFGSRGIEGKLAAVRYAREKRIPFFGICLGLQCAVIEFARNVCGLENANSAEFDENSPDPVIHIMAAQKDVTEKGGTMRLGSYPCMIRPNTLAREIYGVENIGERHRHRFEVNNKYRDLLEAHGMVMSGLSPDGNLVEIIEITDHPFFIAGQFHPELKSRIVRPHPILLLLQ